ncbi:acetyl hydrolase [Afipia sp. P52-10]|jgi:acetyl esterase|uniref:alpha/beta hydrolase n=1 Tax=Afipia sp. P52-10 TaxID=1429916 RepID=UPI0003DF3483|nr:alpha/beta hydrolase [Afipia sp. P52-10]ETR74977.1 acetyl hydrolase [Afipia sp. P52-10]
MPVVLDPSAAAVIKAFREANRPKYETMPAPEARAASALGRAVVQPDPPELASVENISAPSPDGPIPLRVYKPKAPLGHPAPALVFYHGGGWVIGDLDSHDVVCRMVADQAGFIVVAVDYRLAPEHKFPAAAIDAIAATQWVVDNAAKLGIDPNRIFVGGDSAGGNLTAVVTIHARDKGGPKFAGQVLIYPTTDLALSHPSHRDPDTDVLLTHSLMRWFKDHYLNGTGDVDDWRASPARVKDLKGLPRALVITCGADPLHDEGVEYKDRLQASGVEVAYSDYPGQFHGFWTMGKLLPEANTLTSEIAAWLKSKA